jgi:hypothetical protein
MNYILGNYNYAVKKKRRQRGLISQPRRRPESTRTCEFCPQDGLNNKTTGVEIKVADIQNSPPEFLDSLTGVVREDDPIGTLVMTVKARDGDRGMPRKMFYELVTSESIAFELPFYHQYSGKNIESHSREIQADFAIAS